jgi:hypothetical protein
MAFGRFRGCISLLLRGSLRMHAVRVAVQTVRIGAGSQLVLTGKTASH